MCLVYTNIWHLTLTLDTTMEALAISGCTNGDSFIIQFHSNRVYVQCKGSAQWVKRKGLSKLKRG